MKRVGATLGIAALVAACSSPGGPILANPPATRPSFPAATVPPAPIGDPVPIVLPRDDGPHDRLTEWWYYTGHLVAHDQGYSISPQRYGFEFVIFRAERGAFPTSWASHLALTDENGDRFHYAQRLQVGDLVDRSPRASDGTPSGFDLEITAADPTRPETLRNPPWQMAGRNGADHLRAVLSPAEATAAGLPSLSLDLRLTSNKPAALHDTDGWIDFGPGGGSYYYSRTDMSATGVLSIGDTASHIDGLAWFDHQWGDFISVGGGGWDWFAVNLDDGTDITLSLVRDADGSYPLIYGTLVGPDGTTEHLGREAFTVTTAGTWTSQMSGATYPAGWSIAIPGQGLSIGLTPTVAAQELDTRATTGVIYWEGSQKVTARRDGKPLNGEAYVELTGYASAATAP
jgi:predicted secreted hydrolase